MNIDLVKTAAEERRVTSLNGNLHTGKEIKLVTIGLTSR